MSLARCAEHDELRQMMSDFAALMTLRESECRAALLSARVRFSRSFSAHLASERAHLDRLASSPEGSALEPVLYRYDRRMADLRQDYSAHVNAWTPARIADDWPAYCVAVRGLQAQLRAQMAWEEEHLPAY